MIVALLGLILVALVFPGLLRGLFAIFMLIGMAAYYFGDSSSDKGGKTTEAPTAVAERTKAPLDDLPPRRDAKYPIDTKVELWTGSFGCFSLTDYRRIAQRLADASKISDFEAFSRAMQRVDEEKRRLCPPYQAGTMGTLLARSNEKGEDHVVCVTLDIPGRCMWMGEEALRPQRSSGASASASTVSAPADRKTADANNGRQVESDRETVLRIRKAVMDYAAANGETVEQFARRTNTTPDNIESLAYSIERGGGTVSGALRSLDNFARRLNGQQ